MAPELRARVQAAAAELGYRPNRLARNLRRQATEMIGVVVSDIENPHFAETVRALEDAAYRRGYRVVLCNTDEDPAKQRAYLELLAAERPRGVILSASNPGGHEIGELLDMGIAVVAFDRSVDEPRADAVVTDGAAGARLATEHLLAGGHERVGFVAGPEAVETCASRLVGYRAAVEQRGLPALVAGGDFRMAGGHRATSALLAGDPPPSALVVANNLMAVGALRALRERGTRVPDDVSLVAIDDPPWAELVHPPLTVLAQPVRAMAAAAMRLLLARIAHPRRRARRELFDFELRLRGSCGRG